MAAGMRMAGKIPTAKKILTSIIAAVFWSMVMKHGF